MLNNDWQIYALHGFLGLPEDWDTILEGMPCKKIHKIPLFKNPALSIESLAKTADEVNQLALGSDGPKILIGYSLGGRLAMHAAVMNSKLWKGLVLISSHFGLETDGEKTKRLEVDRYWAGRFQTDDWDAITADWNSQPIFGSLKSRMVKEEDFNREFLAMAMRNWSLGHQVNLKVSLEQLDLPILFMAGEKDAKYANLASALRWRHPLSRTIILPNAGHRLHLEQPDKVKEALVTFLREQNEQYRNNSSRLERS